MTSLAEVKVARIGEAGRAGKDIRSDLRVRVEVRDSGGLLLELFSRVSLYYGEAIREQALALLRELEVEHACVRIEDSGALPFAIAARIETAARRAGVVPGRRKLSERVALSQLSPKDRLRCTRLYLPGSEPKYFVNAALYKPDAVIFDLGDSVHSGEKDSARILVRNALHSLDFGNCERMVRINQLPLGMQDLEEIIPGSPDLILLPSVEEAQQVVDVDRRISELAAAAGLDRPLWIIPIIESALGIENAFAIAKASSRVCALTIGLEDYTSDLGVPKTLGGQESLYARMRLVNAAKAAGVQAIDSDFGEVGNLEALARWGEQSSAMGFEGMGCVHPSQIPVVERAFAPSEAEIQKALKITAAYEEAQTKELGVVSLGSKMFDAPVVARALKLVQRAKAMGLVKESDAAQKQETKQ